MAETVKTQFYITAEAMAIINASATEKKRGEWLSRVVLEYHKLLQPPADVDAGGLQESILERLVQIEKQNALILSIIKKEE
mgnify:CR=1 FL=1|jgi:hypothetical protein